MALPLGSCRQFASRNFSEMHERLSGVLKPHGLRRLSSAPVRGVIHRAQLGTLTFNVLRIGPAVDVTPGALESFFLLQVPLAGEVELELGDERVRCAGATCAIVSPGEPLRLRWSDDCAQLVLQIPRDALERRLAARIGSTAMRSLRFQAAVDLSRPPVRELRSLLDFAVDSIEGAGAFAAAPLCAKLEDLLLSALLEVQPHNHTEALRGAAQPAPRHVVRAERAMRELGSEVPSVAQLAALAGVGVRTLHEGFQRFRGTTPMRRLKTFRMEEARRRLLAAGPHARVSDVAAGLGFLQFGRFARDYREAFGEFPSETLRGVRRRGS